MAPDQQSRVTILLVGVWHYDNDLMGKLTGPELDVQNLRDILIEDPELAIYDPRRYIELLNPTSSELRQSISDYVIDRGTDNDILLFYFAGHGAPIGSTDFAFCTKDTYFLPEEKTILPMTAVSFTEILRTLWIKKIIPVFIIDACFSGKAGGALQVTIDQLVESLKGEIQKSYASSYALFCSAPNDEEVKDNPDGDGGLFSATIVELAQEGLSARDKRTLTITLEKLFPLLRERIERKAIGPAPILHLGPTLPDFSICKNVNYSPLEYRLQPHLVAVLHALWDNGNPRVLRPSEIADITGLKGAYGNHQKLSFAPWNLVETVEGSNRKLTERGIAFMRGELQVPQDVIWNSDARDYVARDGTELIGINYFDE